MPTRSPIASSYNFGRGRELKSPCNTDKVNSHVHMTVAEFLQRGAYSCQNFTVFYSAERTVISEYLHVRN